MAFYNKYYQGNWNGEPRCIGGQAGHLNYDQGGIGSKEYGEPKSWIWVYLGSREPLFPKFTELWSRL